MKILIIIAVFFTGVHCGRWDAKHGAEIGERLGKATRDFFKEKDKTP